MFLAGVQSTAFHRRTTLESKSRELGPLQVAVEGSNLNRAINQLKRHMAREGVMKELKRRRHYEKPSIIRKRKMKEAARRRRNDARRRPNGGAVFFCVSTLSLILINTG